MYVLDILSMSMKAGCTKASNYIIDRCVSKQVDGQLKYFDMPKLECGIWCNLCKRNRTLADSIQDLKSKEIRKSNCLCFIWKHWFQIKSSLKTSRLSRWTACKNNIPFYSYNLLYFREVHNCSRWKVGSRKMNIKDSQFYG